MRRKDRDKGEEFALEVESCCDFCVLGVIDTFGMPYTVAINTARDGKNIYFHSAKQGHKIDALKNNNNVCISCVSVAKLAPEKFTTEYKSAVIRGKAFEVLDKQEKIHALKLLCEKFAISNIEMFSIEIAQSMHHTAVWRVEISEATGKSNI